ncbi:MAG: hypothetical protein ACOYXC_14315 [Candidatus Rifleibacteriota bacterium]
MKKIIAFSVIAIFLLSGSLLAQSKKNDIPVKQTPTEVIAVLQEYATILSSESLEKCAEAFIAIAGGSLVDESAKKLRGDVPEFSLKKDFNNFKFYAQPLEITRVNKGYSNGDGYGESAIKGVVYKIWIGKKQGVSGMPAPISILVPEAHPTIKTPKVVGIGSL